MERAGSIRGATNDDVKNRLAGLQQGHVKRMAALFAKLLKDAVAKARKEDEAMAELDEDAAKEARKRARAQAARAAAADKASGRAARPSIENIVRTVPRRRLRFKQSQGGSDQVFRREVRRGHRSCVRGGLRGHAAPERRHHRGKGSREQTRRGPHDALRAAGTAVEKAAVNTTSSPLLRRTRDTPSPTPTARGA